MSKKRKSFRLAGSGTKVEKSLAEPETTPNQSWLSSIRRNWLMVLIISFLALGALGAGLKYLDEDAKRETARRNASKGSLNNKEESFLNKINPFLPDPTPTPTPQLSREYVYAGSRLLGVEDAQC